MRVTRNGADVTDGELRRPRRVFAAGVCDWSGEGLWRKPPEGTRQAAGGPPGG